MLKFQKKMTTSFEFLRPQKSVTPDAGRNPGATKIPLPLQAGDKKTYFKLSFKDAHFFILLYLFSSEQWKLEITLATFLSPINYPLQNTHLTCSNNIV